MSWAEHHFVLFDLRWRRAVTGEPKSVDTEPDQYTCEQEKQNAHVKRFTATCPLLAMCGDAVMQLSCWYGMLTIPPLVPDMRLQVLCPTAPIGLAVAVEGRPYASY